MAKSAATYAGDPRHHHDDLAKLRAENERLRSMRDGWVQRIDALTAANYRLLAEVERLTPLADAARLLGPARMVLDRCAEQHPSSDRHAAEMAQRIVDLIGHPVTDEPPHALVERDELRAEVARLTAELDAARPRPVVLPPDLSIFDGS